MLDMSKNHLSAIERGVKMPKMETFLRIASLLDVSADELLMDVLPRARVLKSSALSEQMQDLTEAEHRLVSDVLEAMLENFRKNKGTENNL